VGRFERPHPVEAGIVGKPRKSRHPAQVMNQQTGVEFHRSTPESNLTA
jgi:hypothetical protein